MRANCGLSGVRVGEFMFKQSGEFGRLTPRLGYNELWFIISDLVRPGNDIRYIEVYISAPFSTIGTVIHSYNFPFTFISIPVQIPPNPIPT